MPNSNQNMCQEHALQQFHLYAAGTELFVYSFGSMALTVKHFKMEVKRKVEGFSSCVSSLRRPITGLVFQDLAV